MNKYSTSDIKGFVPQPLQSTDFNDVLQVKGPEAVRGSIDKARSLPRVQLPDEFFIREDGSFPGLFKTEVRGKNENIVEVYIAPVCHIIGKARDDCSSNWGTLMEWKDPKAVRHRRIILDEMLQGQGREFAQILARDGYSIAPGQVTKFIEFLQGIKTDNFVTCVSRIGWYNGVYVLPDETYGASDETIMYYSLRPVNAFRTGGLLEDWKVMASLCVGNVFLEFAICVAFSGPLLREAGIEGGGLSFEGGSSSGKTTALQVCASIWGGLEHVRSWRTTDNALESVAALLNDNVLILDEVGQVNPTVLSEVAYMLANGQSKGRAGRDGRARSGLSWRLIFLSSGEVGLSDKLSERGLKARAGQEVRFVGIPVDKSMVKSLHGLPSAAALVDRLKALSRENYGLAGREFLKWLCLRLKEVGECIHKEIPEIVNRLCPKEADSQVRRVAARFALVYEAGKEAQKAGLLPPEMDVKAAVQACFNGWLTTRGSSEAAEDLEVISTIRLFIEQHGTSRFQDVSTLNTPYDNVRDRCGFRDKNNHPGEYWFLPESFRKEVLKGFSVQRACKVLREKGWLLPEGTANSAKRTVPGVNRPRFYVIVVPDEEEKGDAGNAKSGPLTPSPAPEAKAGEDGDKDVPYLNW